MLLTVALGECRRRTPFAFNVGTVCSNIARDMIESLVQVKTLKGGCTAGNDDRWCCNHSKPSYLNGDWEAFNAKRNCFSSKNGSISPKAALKTIEAVRSLGSIWLGKVGEVSQIKAEMSRVLVAHGARLVSAVRSNALDYLVCIVRDCFGFGKFKTPFARLVRVGGQYPVDAYTGERSYLCFNRRQVEKGNQKGNTTKAFLNTDVLVEALKSIMVEHKRQLAALAASFPRLKIAQVTYEDLTAFEWMEGSKGLEISTRAWWTVMVSLGFEQRASIASIRGYLRKNDWFGSRPPPKKHADVIWNIADVRDTLLATGNASLIAMMRL